MRFGANRQIDVPRLKADVAAATVELLSAHCALDRVRLQYSPHEVVTHGERDALKKAVAFADALHDFFSQVDRHIQLAEKAER